MPDNGRFVWGAHDTETSLCVRCSRKNKHKSTCAAYANGIPMQILRGVADHHFAYPGDNGLQFVEGE